MFHPFVVDGGQQRRQRFEVWQDHRARGLLARQTLHGVVVTNEGRICQERTLQQQRPEPHLPLGALDHGGVEVYYMQPEVRARGV